MTIAHSELLLERGAKTDPKNVGSGRIDGVNDAGFFVLAAHISTRLTDNVEVGIRRSDVSCCFVYDPFCPAEQVHARPLALAH